jgi:hypothetical protein
MDRHHKTARSSGRRAFYWAMRTLQDLERLERRRDLLPAEIAILRRQVRVILAAIIRRFP